MKVGVFTGDTTPDAGGGYTFVHDVLDAIIAARPRSQHEFVILTTAAAAPSSGTLPVVSLDGLGSTFGFQARIRTGRLLNRFLGRPWVPWTRPRAALDRMIAASGVDIIWYLTPGGWLEVGLPFVTVVWDLQHRRQPEFPEVGSPHEFEVRDAIYANCLRRAAMVIAGTEVGRDEIATFYGVLPERIRILPHPTPGFALAAAAAGGTERPSAAPPDPYLFYPAQFWPHKNHANLLAALKLLRESGLPFSLALSGSDKGNLAFVQETAAQMGVADAVRFLGFVDRKDLTGLYRHAFALCYPTFFGPENLPPLEGFALGCPVIASDVAGAREQLGDAAELFDPRRPDALAAAVRRLHEDPGARARLIERGRARARRFTASHFVDGVLSWLDDFAGVRRNWPNGLHRPG